MIALTGYTVFQYLQNRGIVNREEFVAGNLVMIDNPFPSSRNANFIVRRTDGKNLFLKQTRRITDVMDRRKELLFYELVEKPHLGLEKHCLKAVMPIDTRNQVLILDHSDQTFTFEALIACTPAPLRGTRLRNPTRQIGQMLAYLRQKLRAETACDSIYLHRFGTFTPWLLTLREQDVLEIEKANNRYLSAFGRFVQQHKGLLQGLLRNWQFTHLINTDVCWRNILTSGNTPDQDSPYFLIDWEFASVGDPDWEMASLAAEYLVARFTTADTLDVPALASGQYWALIPVLLESVVGKIDPLDPTCWKVMQLLGVILLQHYYRWAVEGAQSKLVDFPKVYAYAQRCLTETESVLREF